MRVILHAPTAPSVARARASARQFQRLQPEAEVRIVANAQGVAAALAERDAETDHLLLLCEATLEAKALPRPERLATTPAAVVTIARMQAEGWTYLRA